jgi:hypothetical protein
LKPVRHYESEDFNSAKPTTSSNSSSGFKTELGFDGRPVFEASALKLPFIEEALAAGGNLHHILSLAKTSSPLVSATWEMGCNVVELGYKRSRRRIMELDDILARDRLRWPPRKVFFDGSGLAISTSR